MVVGDEAILQKGPLLWGEVFVGAMASPGRLLLAALCLAALVAVLLNLRNAVPAFGRAVDSDDDEAGNGYEGDDDAEESLRSRASRRALRGRSTVRVKGRSSASGGAGLGGGEMSPLRSV